MVIFHSAVYHLPTEDTSSARDEGTKSNSSAYLSDKSPLLNSSSQKSLSSPSIGLPNKNNVILADFTNTREVNVPPSTYFSDTIDKILSKRMFDIRPPTLHKMLSTKGIMKQSYAFEG
jgi:hypothetical protein